jgi:poly(3-hydroxybutyrate) depolymerase
MASGAAQAGGPDDAQARGRSAGCGTATTGTGHFERIAVRVRDRDRTYHLRIPGSYDPDRAYPLVFRWHGRGGDGLSGGLDIERSSGNEAIVVAADGLDKSWRAGADDLALFDTMLETIEKHYCVDRGRVYSYGFSAGAYFTNRLACERGDVLRASAAIAGGYAPGGPCTGKVASWFLHDVDDDTVPVTQGRAALQRALAANGCTAETVDRGEGCVSYRGCGAAPVMWCQSYGYGHDIRGDFAPARVWKFFQDLH